MDLKFRIQTKVNKPVARVFEAIAGANEINNYFTNSTSGPLEEGKRIIWGWSGVEDHPVDVKQIIPNEKIVLSWNANKNNYNTETVIEFDVVDDDTTMVKISEQGWKTDQKGLDSSYNNCSGWQHMASSLKMYLEHKIDLRK